jgi:hypothetical protein
VEVKNSLKVTASKKGIDSDTKIYTIPNVMRMAIKPENIKTNSIILSKKFRLMFLAKAGLILGFALDLLLTIRKTL